MQKNILSRWWKNRHFCWAKLQFVGAKNSTLALSFCCLSLLRMDIYQFQNIYLNYVQ